MLDTALRRFWRGVREPWQLLGRMRQDRALWARYWRTVVVQAALTLVVGLGVFWVAKEGAEAWKDAFGPDDVEESSAPAAAGSGSTTGARAPDQKASAGAKPQSPTTSPPPLPRTPGAAVPPPPRPPPATQRTPAQPSGAVGATPSAAAPSTTGEDEEKEEETSAEDDEAFDRALEEKVKALEESRPEERSKRTAELIAAAVEKAKKASAVAKQRAERRKGKVDEKADELTEDREGLSEKLEELTIAAEALALGTPSRGGDARRARRHLERELDQLERDARTLEQRGAPPLTAQDRARLERARAALVTAHRHERGLPGRIGAVLALLAAIYASLGIAQTAILALSRDFHDVLSRDLSLLVNVAPEDPPMRPKVRLDIPWLRRKTKRRVRFFIGFLPGAILINIVARLVPPHRTITTVLTALWAAYWWMVMTAGQSARAWTPPETTQRPWYLRAWFTLCDRVFLFRWGLPRWWGTMWDRMARNFHGPAERVEEQPLEFAGLALSRALVLIPVVKLLLRPVYPVAVAHLLVEHATTARLPIPVTAAEVADAAAHAPDSEARAHSGVASPVQGS